MKLKLKSFGRVDLDGTHRTLVELSAPAPEGMSPGQDGAPRFVKVTHGARACACILAGVKVGGSDRLILDRFKQRHLLARDGEEVTVEVINLPEAQVVELKGPPEIAEVEAKRFLGKPLSKGEMTALFAFTGEARFVEVAAIKPGDAAVVTSATQVRIAAGEPETAPLSWEDIGGLKHAIAKLREAIEYPLRFHDLFDRLGIQPPRGIILHGPPGTGKTLLARALAHEAGAKYYCVSGPELFSKFYGETEAGIRGVFEEAARNAPAIVVIDELDALVPNRAHTMGDLERRAVATVLTQMDGLQEMPGVIVIGTTNRIHSIDPALRRGGRFEHEVHIGVPDTLGRREILEIHTRRTPLSPDVDLGAVADRTVGFVGADLASLCREAAYNALRRAVPPGAFNREGFEPEVELRVTKEDFDAAILAVSPSAMREFMVEIPSTRWSDIGGLEKPKQLLSESVTFAVRRRALLDAIGLRLTRGILLYGPPGTGKTLLGRAAARECGANFIYVKGPEIRSKWYGESEARIRLIFERAAQCAPCIVFIDEIDSIAAARGTSVGSASDRADASVVNQLLAEMDGVQAAAGVLVIGATNMPDLLDPALLRPGRFDYQIDIPLPDPASRRAILDVHLAKKPVAPDLDWDVLIRLTHGFSGAELEEVCRDAALAALRETDFDVSRTQVNMEHMKAAVARVLENASKLKPRRIGFAADSGDKGQGPEGAS